MGVEDSLSKLGKSKIPEKDESLLLSLPFEIREKIYTHVFATTHAQYSKHRCHHDIAILQTCTQIHSVASSVLYSRTPLRFVIGHRQVFASMLPPSPILDRFQNIDFKLTRNGLDPSLI